MPWTRSEFPFFQERSSSFAQIAPVPTTYVNGTDHDLMEFSGAGDVQAEVVPVDLNLMPPRASTSGCEAADFAGLQIAGKIALMQRGTCSFGTKVAVDVLVDRCDDSDHQRGRCCSTAWAAVTLLTMFPPVKIVSGGLEIREFGSQDAVQVAAFVATRDRTALPPGSPEAVADVDGWLAETVHQRRLDGGGVHLVIVEGTSGEIVGSIGLRDTDWEAGRSEIGYGVRASRRGRGYATEAARAVGRWALTDGGMRRVQLHARLDNVASLRVAEKAGYQREGTLRMAEWEGGAAHDLAVFSMIAIDLETAEVAR